MSVKTNINKRGRLSFRGGIHPPQCKYLSQESKIQPGPAPKTVSIMLSQHTGAVCTPTVTPDQQVKAGQKVGDSDAFVSAPVHSPVNGKVREIGLQSHAVLGRSPAVIIEADPEGNWPKQPCFAEFTDDFDLNRYSIEQICTAVRQAGIVGMGGAGFPTRVKIEPNPRLPKETMIINGCECEPYITCDERIMVEWTKQIIAGVKLTQKTTGVKRVFIGIEDNKPQAVEAVGSAIETCRNTEDIKVVVVKTKYPQGGERQLIKAILRKNVPSAGIPPMIGVVVLNVATVAAIAEAVVLGAPLTHRVVTVTGEGIARTGNYYVAIGTPVQELIYHCGGLTEDAVRVILGGPMMGVAISDFSMPVTKTADAITVLTKKQIGEDKLAAKRTACIHCGQCLQACPEHLNPTRIAHAVRKNLLDVAQEYYISACTECGCCSYVCPANIELTGHIKTGKILLARQKKRMPQ